MGKMNEPGPVNELDSIKKGEPRADFMCDKCGARIGTVYRMPTEIRRLVKDNGEWWEGYGAALCPHCGNVRRWIPGQEHIRLITERNNKYQLT